MVSKEQVRSAILCALKEEFNLTFATDADALHAICDMDSLDKIDLGMEVEYQLDACLDFDTIEAALDCSDVDRMLDLIISATY